MIAAWRGNSLRWRWLLGVAALGIMPVERAQASDSTTRCLRAYEVGQRLRQAGDLLNAAAELRVCGGPACPVRMQGDCQRWLDDVERSTPTVIFRVRDAGGERLSNVTVSIDGASPRRLDGRALLMNPGEHRVLFERPGYRVLETPVFVIEGEKLEARDVVLEPLLSVHAHDVLLPPGSPVGVSEASSAPEQSFPISPGALALGAVGVLGGAGVVFFGLRAKSGEQDLERCSPDCSRAQVDDVERDYLWSNVSLTVGVAGLVGAGLLLVFDEPPARASAVPRHGVQLGRTATWVTRF